MDCNHAEDVTVPELCIEKFLPKQGEVKIVAEATPNSVAEQTIFHFNAA